ncbi:MAG: GNAT family N-acetyltransferase [Candidatus Puniceispirillales bacterium]
MISLAPLTADRCPGLEGIDPAWPAATLAGLASRPAFRGLLAEVDAAPAGFIIGWAVAGEAEIIQISVATSHRRQGIGAALLERFLNDHAPAGCRLDVRPDNRAAIGLYRRFGFREEGVREGYYRGDNTADALLMRLDTPRRES